MSPPPAPPPRATSVDAYRGLVMFLMMAEVLRLSRVAKAFPDDPVWQFLGHHQTHAEWRGCTLHDLIQPSFSFLVGTALAFSVAGRVARGQSFGRQLAHAVWRSAALIFLGVFLRSVGRGATNWTFEDTLTQIGLGYTPLFLLAYARRDGKPGWHFATVAVILVGCWAAFAAFPSAGPPYYVAKQSGVPEDWPHHPSGFAVHWDKNNNAAANYDDWFLNRFPRAKPFRFNPGGYTTMNFVPTLATMLLGLVAGGWLRAGRPRTTVRRLAAVGAASLALGYGLDAAGVCPSVKRIWTPSWVLFSGGWCFLILAGFVAVCDVLGRAEWSFPLRVIGANSIVAYCAAHLLDDFIVGSVKTHLGADVFRRFGTAYEPFAAGVVILAVNWLVLYWMYRNRIFVRI